MRKKRSTSKGPATSSIGAATSTAGRVSSAAQVEKQNATSRVNHGVNSINRSIIGSVATPEQHTNATNVAISDIQVGELALILRSDKSWRYAELKSRAPEKMTFIAESGGHVKVVDRQNYRIHVRRLPPGWGHGYHPLVHHGLGDERDQVTESEVSAGAKTPAEEETAALSASHTGVPLQQPHIRRKKTEYKIDHKRKQRESFTLNTLTDKELDVLEQDSRKEHYKFLV
jgi:hypothetical protein